jgi:hypothetical protein
VRNGDSKIVKDASGVINTNPLPGERLRTWELVAYVKGTKGLKKTREFIEVEMSCSKILAVAAKQEAK